MKLNQVIAKLLTQKGLPIEASQIIKIQEFHKVYNVIIKGRRPRFVSKARVLELMLEITLIAKTHKDKKMNINYLASLLLKNGFSKAIVWEKYGFRRIYTQSGYLQIQETDKVEIFGGHTKEEKIIIKKAEEEAKKEPENTKAVEMPQTIQESWKLWERDHEEDDEWYFGAADEESF